MPHAAVEAIVDGVGEHLPENGRGRDLVPDLARDGRKQHTGSQLLDDLAEPGDDPVSLVALELPELTAPVLARGHVHLAQPGIGQRLRPLFFQRGPPIIRGNEAAHHNGI
jgi:hypothetical protein